MLTVSETMKRCNDDKA